MRDEPAVNRVVLAETMQIGIVMRDLEASIRLYQTYGVGPWGEFMTVGQETAPTFLILGHPARGCRPADDIGK